MKCDFVRSLKSINWWVQSSSKYKILFHKDIWQNWTRGSISTVCIFCSFSTHRTRPTINYSKLEGHSLYICVTLYFLSTTRFKMNEPLITFVAIWRDPRTGATIDSNLITTTTFLNDRSTQSIPKKYYCIAMEPWNSNKEAWQLYYQSHQGNYEQSFHAVTKFSDVIDPMLNICSI